MSGTYLYRLEEEEETAQAYCAKVGLVFNGA